MALAVRAEMLGCGYLLQEPQVERVWQEFTESNASCFAPQIREDHFEIASELPQDLAACPARRRGRPRIRDDGDAAECAVSFRECLEHRDALGADREAERGVLDIAARDHGAIDGLERGAHLEVR